MMQPNTHIKPDAARMLGDTAADRTYRAQRQAAAFGMAAAITVVFNTLLALAKDAYEPLNHFMAKLTGHHWISHAVFDLLVFLALGWGLSHLGMPASGLTNRLVMALTAAVVIAGAGLGTWFLFF